MNRCMAAGAMALVLAMCSAPVCAAGDYPLEQRETFQRSLSGANTLDVDNINGFVHVTGDSGSTIRLEGEKIVRARDAEEMARAKREVTLDVNEKDGVAQFYVNGPFRGHDHSSDYHGFHDDESRHYDVTYNLTIHAPRAIALRLKTVNGQIQCADTSGKFDIHGVNGSIQINGIEGSGEIRTVNGSQVISFRASPAGDTNFQTVNGRIDVTFPKNLSADVSVKTLNGDAYTNFDATALAGSGGVLAAGSRWNFRRNQAARLRIGNGGPALNFETVNGSIQIRKAQ